MGPPLWGPSGGGFADFWATLRAVGTSDSEDSCTARDAAGVSSCVEGRSPECCWRPLSGCRAADDSCSRQQASQGHSVAHNR